MELLITTHTEEDPVALVLTGSIDLVSRDGLKDAGLEHLRAGRSVTLDMAGVEFIDSTGIGAIVDLMVEARAAGLGFGIGRRSERVDRILEITGLDDTLAQS